LLEGKLQKSPAPDHVRTRLESASLSLEGDFVRELNGKAGAARVTSIEYRMKDVAISEIAMSQLLEIQDILLHDPKCDETVQLLLRAHQTVCAGYAALSATTSYRVRYDSTYETNAEAKAPVVQAVKAKIEAVAGSRIQIGGDDELTGENLFYGIQLTELCITRDSATEPSVLPNPPARPTGPQASM
jgi:hypothetical protein